MTTDLDINKIVTEVFRSEFPGAHENEVLELIQNVGQTIIVESMAKTLDAIEENDKTEDKIHYHRVKDLMEAETDYGTSGDESRGDMILEISNICVDLDIDLEKIYQEVATDVVRDVLGK